jgi:hypothetical protein
VTGQLNQIMDIEWDPNTQNQDELDSMLTFILFNCTTNKARIFTDVVARSEGEASVTVPIDWVDAMTALHIVTTDYTQFLSNMPKRVIKFKAGVDLASTVK